MEAGGGGGGEGEGSQVVVMSRVAMTILEVKVEA